jgi:CRISPR-associated protein Csm3
MSAHTAATQLTFLGKLIVEGDLVCETGLHIGAGKGSLEIGGADNPVVKDSWGRPYVPGSSIKGRLRSLLEQATGMAVPAEMVYLSKRRGQEVRIHQSNRPDDEICLLFGRSPSRLERVSSGEGQGGQGGESVATPARLTVSDAPLQMDSITAQMRENQDDELTEVKSETAIDRITAQSSPRTLERVPAGAKFSIRVILDVLCEEDKTLAAGLAQSLRLLEDDTLGGGGSRGSGRVKVAGLKMTWRGKGYYSAGEAEQVLVEGAGAAELQQTVSADDFGSKLS